MALTLIVSWLGLSACTTPTDPGKAEYWIDKLDDKQQRNEALKQLGKIGDKKAVPEVLEWFEREGDWQPDAAYALGQLGDRSVVSKLVAKIDYKAGSSRDRQTRNKNRTNINIVRALALLGATEATEDVTQLLGVGQATVREAVIKSLGKLGDPKGVEPLLKVVDEEPEPFLRKVAIQALGELGDPRAVPTLIKMLFIEMPNVSFYYEAHHSLIQMGDAAIPQLIATFRRQNQDVEAIRMLDGSTIGEGAVEAKTGSVLGYLRAKGAGPLIIDALGQLYRRYQQRGRAPVFASVPGAIRELCYALGNVGTQGAVKALLPIASDVDGTVRETAADALTQIGDRSVVKAMLLAARDGNTTSRKFALVAASRLGRASDLAAFDALAKSDGKQVPAKVMSKMVERERVRLVAAHECKTIIACWQQKLKDPDYRVRDKAAWELGWLGGTEAVDDLMIAAEDDEAIVRMAAILSLGRIGGANPDKLEELYDKYATKLEYAGVNIELKRLIARLRAKGRKQR